MPREIINLVSSSPQPDVREAPEHTINKTSSATLTQKSAADLPASIDWVEISSEEDILPTLRSSYDVGNVLEHTKPIDSVKSKALLLPLTSDDDSPTLPSLRQDMASYLPSKHAEARQSLKRDRDFYYLSEDFDTTIDLCGWVDDGWEGAQKSTPDSLPPGTKAIMVRQRQLATNKKPRNHVSGYKRSSSNVDGSTKSYAPVLKKSRTASNGKMLELDPIIFTSSPDPYLEAANARAAKRQNATGSRKISSFDVLPDLSSDPPLPSEIEPLSVASRGGSTSAAWEKYEAERQRDKQKSSKRTDPTKQASSAPRDKERKVAEKEAEKEDKRLAKESKVKEKEKAAELAKVNTLRTDKKVSALEMIVELPSCLNPEFKSQTEGLLNGLRVEHQTWNSLIPVVKFRRKINAEYNEELGLWEPVNTYIKTEKHIIYVMTSQEFVSTVTKDGENNIDTLVCQLKSRFEGYQITFLVQGYNVFIRKNRNIKNRQFTQAVRAAGPAQEAPTSSQTHKKKGAEYINEETLEDAMFSLQTVHDLMVHHVNVQHEAAEQIVVFTQQISTIPYKAATQTLDSTFCMESGQVKTGDGPEDTYVKMLQEIVRLTAPIAYGIKDKYPNVGALIEGCLKEGPNVVEECRKSANKDGAFTDRRVGPAISKRVWKVFTGRDVNSLDV